MSHRCSLCAPLVSFADGWTVDDRFGAAVNAASWRLSSRLTVCGTMTFRRRAMARLARYIALNGLQVDRRDDRRHALKYWGGLFAACPR